MIKIYFSFHLYPDNSPSEKTVSVSNFNFLYGTQELEKPRGKRVIMENVTLYVDYGVT